MDSPWYVRNADLHRDLRFEKVSEEILKLAAAHDVRLRRHINEQASSLVQSVGSERRLKRVRTNELVSQFQR